MKITKLTRKTHRYNEDAYFIKKNLFVVIDGASGLYGASTNYSDASILVSLLLASLKKYDAKKDNIIDYLYSFSKNLANNKEYDFNSVPSCGISICEIKSNVINVYQIGDVECCVIKKDGSKELLRNNDLPRLDSIAMKELVDISKKENISILKSQKRILNTLRYNRSLMNKENGYQVFQILDNPNFKFTKYIYDLKDVACLYLASDGYYESYEILKLYPSYKELYSLDSDIVKIKNEIVKTWNEDADCSKYPRFKKYDDLTVLKIVF